MAPSPKRKRPVWTVIVGAAAAACAAASAIPVLAPYAALLDQAAIFLASVAAAGAGRKAANAADTAEKAANGNATSH